MLSLLANKASADKVYDPNFELEGGWDKWCSWAAKQGKIARIVRSLAKNAMSFDFAGGDEKDVDSNTGASLLKSIRTNPNHGDQ
ncbi:hypothetical protein DRP04_05605 [Archaeoglobales archaeon]|nr:MAG: hypothetical protein DRP04_05605 [Archaeoglobales archaeon]